MTGHRILILSSLHLCRNPRVVKEAAALGAAGYDVTVMSISWAARFEAIDRGLAAGRPFRRVTLDLAGTGAGSRFRSLLDRGRTWLARRALRHFGVESVAALGPASRLLRLARSFPADLVIAHTEIPLWIATRLAGGGRRVAVDFEDWYSRDLLARDRRHRPLRLLERCERAALRRATFTLATSEAMAEALVGAHGGTRPTVVRNTFPLQPRTRAEADAGSEPPAFIWFSQTVGPGRGLEAFLAAWNRTANPSRVILLGEVGPDYRSQLIAAVSPDRRGRLAFSPAVAPHELPDKLAEFDVGLALELHQPPNKDVTISNKILQYLNAGLAIVATDTAGQTEVMRQAPDCGVLVNARDPARVVARLDELLGDRSRLRACQRAARAAAVAEFNWDKDAARLLAAVAGALDVAAPAA